jgi:hypothetical protein
MNRTRRLIGLLIAAGLVSTVAFPASALANPPESTGNVIRVEEQIGVFYDDLDDQLVVLTGLPAEEWCPAFEAGFIDFPLASVQLVETPTGAVAVLVSGTGLAAWVYSAATIADLCATVAAGGSPDLLAEGSLRFRINANDWFGSGTRTISIGDRATGTFVAPDGTSWHLTATFKAVLLPSDGGNACCVVFRSDIHLTQSGG